MSTPAVRIRGFSTASNRRLLCALAIAVCALCGWTLAGLAGIAGAALLAVLAVCVPWWGQPAWSWLLLWWLRTRSVIQWTEPITVANNRSGGGVRIHDGVAVVAVRLLGKAHAATQVTGSVSVHTDNTVDVAALAPILRQSLGLNLESLSVITAGARRGVIGDYPRVYDTLIGTPPYAGRRETWLIMRMRIIDNTGSLRWRTTVGAAAIAVAQRVAGTLRCQGLRARVATANDIIELERRHGVESLTAPSQRWTTLRADTGWWTTYAYPADEINTETLAAAWNLPVDDVIQNITVLPDGTCTATVTVRTPQPSPTPPAVVLARLNGEQAAAAAANLCGPRPHLRGLRPAPLPDTLSVDIGPSGILIGKLANGDRLLVPLTDSGELSRVFIAADEHIAKRFVIRAAGAGESVCVHTGDPVQWASVRMPGIAVVDGLRPLPRTTVSVIDNAMTLSPRPATVITVAAPGTPPPPAGAVEVSIEQINRSTVRISAAGRSWLAEVELFRAENRYCSDQSFSPAMSN